jgi:hypothetical protein
MSLSPPNMLTFGQDLHSDQIMMEDVKSMSGETQRSVRKRITGQGVRADLFSQSVCLLVGKGRPHVVLSPSPSVCSRRAVRTQIEGHLKGESNGVECMCTGASFHSITPV